VLAKAKMAEQYIDTYVPHERDCFQVDKHNTCDGSEEGILHVAIVHSKRAQDGH
jgi:hypothetical protein